MFTAKVPQPRAPMPPASPEACIAAVRRLITLARLTASPSGLNYLDAAMDILDEIPR